MFSKHLKLIELSPQLNLVQSFRTIVHQSSLYSINHNGKLIYQPLPLEDVWIGEKVRRGCRNELQNQSRLQEDSIHYNNREVPDIIHLNTKDNNARPTTDTLVSEDKLSVDYSLGHPPTESEGYYVSNNADDALPNSPSTNSNIPSPSQPSPPNNSQKGDIS